MIYIMKVVLLAHTKNGAELANLSARTCYSNIPPSDIEFDPMLRSMKHAISGGHLSILEHVSFTFSIEGISRACSHQLVRHRLASYSMASQRYIKMDGFDFIVPQTIADATDDIFNEYQSLMVAIDNTYKSFIERGIPEEDARYILPNACTTNLVLTMNARELIHFFSLRCCERAQWEIRGVANSMLSLCKVAEPEIFENIGASCITTGRCPEGKKSCGKVKNVQKVQS